MTLALLFGSLMGRQLRPPTSDPFTQQLERDQWRTEVEEGCWDRLKHSRACLAVAEAITPHLEKPAGLGPWTEDFLNIVRQLSLDQVVHTGVEVLGKRKDVLNFVRMRQQLLMRCDQTAGKEWAAYLSEVLKAAQDSATFTKAKLARDRLIAHESLDPMKGVSHVSDLRLDVSDIADLQRLAEDVFRSFPEGNSFHFEPVVAKYYPEIVERIVAGDRAPTEE